MIVDDSTIVVVRRHWNGWDGSGVALGAVTRWHWRDSSGGHGARSPRPFLHGYMMCDADLAYGEIAHTCQHGPPPHRILVCLVQKDNPKAIVDRVKQLAAEESDRSYRRGNAVHQKYVAALHKAIADGDTGRPPK